VQIIITLIDRKGERDLAVNSKQVLKDTMIILGVIGKKVYSHRLKTDVDINKSYDDNGIFYGDKLEVKG
jgi:hypothetical protein